MKGVGRGRVWMVARDVNSGKGGGWGTAERPDRERGRSRGQSQRAGERAPDKDKDQADPKGKLIQAEDREVGAVGWGVYKAYFRAAGLSRVAPTPGRGAGLGPSGGGSWSGVWMACLLGRASRKGDTGRGRPDFLRTPGARGQWKVGAPARRGGGHRWHPGLRRPPGVLVGIHRSRFPILRDPKMGKC